ncbi:MAG: ABC transporter permease [Dehalococcoidia bacterium]|nr:ABC transporter permease [Dehalococcoidia bacterium]
MSLGMIAGYYRGRVDDMVTWVLTTLASIPALILLISGAVLFRPSPLTLAIFFGVISWTGVARLVRGQAFSLREREYVVAAYASGASGIRIMLRHIAPNVAPIVITITGIDVASVILTESALSYLGLGIQPPTPSWGNMLTNAGAYIFKAGRLVVPPGACITLTVLCLYIIGDGLRDALDPRLRR